MIAAIVAALVIGLGTPLSAQTPTSRLVVHVRDAGGGALAGVTVVIAEQATALTRRTTTSADGLAPLTGLPAGTYTVTVSLTGFRTGIVHELRLTSSVDATLPLVLDPGPFSEQIVVIADAGTLRAGTSGVGHVFDRERIGATPLHAREVLPLVTHAAGVSPPAPGSRLSTQGNTGINNMGAREASNNFLLDGLDNNDQFIGRLIIAPSLEAIQEVTVLQNTYNAEHGRSGGAHVNMVLRSGSRDWTGSLYEFFRDSALDARSPLQAPDRPESSFARHLFGGSLGGPIERRSSFFFVNAEGLAAREADHRLAHVPTIAERNGDFSASGVTIADPISGQPFPNNRIPDERIGDVARAVIALYPPPTRQDPAANLAASGQDERHAGQVNVKTDHHFGAENFLSFRYSFSRDSRDLPFVARNRNLPGFGLSSLDQGQHFGAGLTSTLSSRVMNVLRVGVHASRRENLPGRSGVNGFDVLGMIAPLLPAEDLGFPAIDVSGYEMLGDDPNLPVVRRTRTTQISHQLAIEGQQHRVKVGGDVRTYRSDGYNHLFSRGQITFSGAFTGHPLGDVLLGRPTFSLIAANDNRQALRTWSAAGYVQDSWRVLPSVTLDAGLRYEYFSAPTDAGHRMRVFDLDAHHLVDVGTNGVPASGLDADVNNLAPRVAVSWDPSGHGTLVIRGGYGLFYDAGTLIENSALYFNPPFFVLRIAAPATIEDPFPVEGGFVPAPSVNTLDRSFRTAYSQQASVSIERVFRELTLNARFVTSRGRNLVRKRNINQPAPGPGPLDARRPIPDFADILLVESKATSKYDGLQLGVDRQLFRGVAFHAAYTWSRSLDDASAFLASDGNDNTPQDSRHSAAEWGPSDFDVRHRLVLSAIWQLPAMGRSALLRNWQVSGTLTAQAGRPFTPRLSFDNSNTGNGGGATFAFDRPDMISGPLPPGQSSYTYGGRTFVIPPPFTFGNAGRNLLTGPGYASLDLLVSRRLSIAGRRALELRLEVFNVLNRRNDQLPDSFLDHATFGRSLATYPPRQTQLAARLIF
ncbi:MAG TPA: TonB-dependent receptor [Vicinamibacterales bacterium]|nr:TonB-dependent receptor [Vicinamibacterales bacterium]